MMMAALGIMMTTIGMIAHSFILFSAGGGAAVGAQLGHIFMHLCCKPDRIDLSRVRRRRGGGPIGCRTLPAPFRRISHRRTVVRRMQRHTILSRGRLLLVWAQGLARTGEKLF